MKKLHSRRKFYFLVICGCFIFLMHYVYYGTAEPTSNYLDKVKDITGCLDKSITFNVQSRGDYWVLYNYVRAEKTFKCHESITYTTQADYSFLDNLLPMVQRWRGPISVALHAPGYDFIRTLDSISYLRHCTDKLVREYVTFHIFFGSEHVPKKVPGQEELFSVPFNCSLPPPFFNVSWKEMYKTQNNILYPINVARNIAREMAQTHYVFASDIELYPSPNIIPQFLKMIADNSDPFLIESPKVFPLHVFEVAARQTIPETKTELQKMLAAKKAVPFHKYVCNICHTLPEAKAWRSANETTGLKVFSVGKRTGKFKNWEPFYIGTHAEPLFDERLTWEGKSNKMTQAYTLCILDYKFLILDNAFLVHRPGIKVFKEDKRRTQESRKTNKFISKVLLPQLNVIYGTQKGCDII